MDGKCLYSYLSFCVSPCVTGGLASERGLKALRAVDLSRPLRPLCGRL